MAKYVIKTVELIKKEWIVEAYSPDEARDYHYDRRPAKVERIGEVLFSEECINEYEFDQLWKSLDKDTNLDWVEQERDK